MVVIGYVTVLRSLQVSCMTLRVDTQGSGLLSFRRETTILYLHKDLGLAHIPLEDCEPFGMGE
jgi:hypothetical protein